MKGQQFIEEKISAWGDDVVTSLLVIVALCTLIVAARKSLGLKVAWLGYLALP